MAALNLNWTFGFNKNIINGVQCLATESRHAMVYIAAHTGVIYDYESRTQKLLQGHCNPIQCCTVSEDKRWIVTADTGPDSMLVVWDSTTGQPIKTIFTPHALGVQALDLSPDAMFLATLSARSGDDGKQEISIWEWSNDKSEALHTTEIVADDLQCSVRFNTYDVRELVTTGEQRVIFWSWENSRLEFFAPPLVQQEFKQSVGSFTQSLFVPESKQAITATDDGDLIVWDATAKSSMDYKAIKIVRVSGTEGAGEIAIRVMTEIDGYLVLGNEDGTVRFYDFDFRLTAWFEDLKAGPISSISFGATTTTESEDSSSFDDGFNVPKFIVGTRNSFIIGVDAAVFNEYNASKRRGTLLVQGIDDEIHGVSSHPQGTLIAISSYSGAVQIWNYLLKRLVMVRKFDTSKLRPQCMCYSPSGHFLTIGFTNGTVKVVDSASLEDITTLKQSAAAIQEIRFSVDSSFLATADITGNIYLWRHTDTDEHDGGDWVFLGRSKSHSKRIIGLEFSTSVEGEPTLVSVGEDSRMIQYDLLNTSIANGIVLRNNPNYVEQECTPSSCFWYPGLQEDCLVVANSEYKMKKWNVDSQSCRSTTLGPTFGDPINRIINIPSSGENNTDDHYCVYSTPERVIGVMKLPLDGNPNKAMGLIAHPGEITGLEIDYQGKFLFSAGGTDTTVNMWEVDVKPLNTTEAAGGQGAEPFLDLIEGGKSGEFYDEIVNYFYFCQLRTQGEASTATRDISGVIPLREIPQMMRALGYYPSEEEIENMCSEIKYSKFAQSTEIVEEINLEDFIKLYVNHRPVFGVGKDEVQSAFKALGANPEISWEGLKEELCKSGERMDSEELNQCLSALLGDDDLPQDLDASDFADKICGFEDYDESSSLSLPEVVDS